MAEANICCRSTYTCIIYSYDEQTSVLHGTCYFDPHQLVSFFRQVIDVSKVHGKWFIYLRDYILFIKISCFAMNFTL